jgi:hypothetical protein
MADMVEGMGMSPDEVVSLCREIRAQGFWISAWLGSKNYPGFIPRDSSASTWKQALDPYLLPLISQDLLHHAVIGGEFDLWNIGETNDPTPFEIAEYVVGTHVPMTYFHFSTHVTWWGGSADRFDWTQRMSNLGVRGLYYQGDVNWNVGEYQGRICDTLGHPGIPAEWDFVNHEIVAAAEFTQDHPDEYDACQKSYMCQCAIPQDAAVHQWGYGNGGYRPDGSYL